MRLSSFISNRLAFDNTNRFTRVLIGIAVASVTLSVAVMIISMAVITGFKSTITQKIFGFWGHIHITDTHMSRSYEPVPIEHDLELLKNLSDVDYTDIDSENTPGDVVKHVQSFVFLPGVVKTRQEMDGLVLKGISDDFDTLTMRQYILDGRLPRIGEQSRDILLSEQTASRLDVSVGDKVIVYFFEGKQTIKRRFKVSGLYRTGLEEYDIKFALTDMRILQQVLDWDSNQIAGYEVYVHDPHSLSSIADHLYEDILPRKLYSETIQEKFPSIFDWLELQEINEQIIILLMLLVCVINMATIVLILILERTKLIGVLKSLGTTNRTIRTIFIRYAFWILLFGLVLGNVVGLGFCWLQKRFEFIKLDETNYYVSTAPIQIEWLQVVGINLLAIIVVLICLYIPTIVAGRISPVKVLKFD